MDREPTMDLESILRVEDRALREHATLLSMLLDHAPVEVAIKDLQGRYLKVNPASEEIFGATEQEIQGTFPHGHLPDSYADEFARHDQDVLQNQTVIQRECRVPRSDGERVFRIVKFPIYNSDKTMLAIGSIGLDVTDLKQTQADLKATVQELERLKERIAAENLYLKDEIRQHHHADELVGNSAALKRELKRVEQVAATDVTVLIQGETGTGKELIARGLHQLSRRSDKPLIKVNCPALAPTLVESELFGHEKGAFTGALSRKSGRFELADHATIFLDEIGDLSLDLQAKLLRVLQEGEFERVGSSDTRRVDVRVIAATNRNLTEAVAAGKFREDLYYRLNVFPITLPPLRERKADIPVLARFFVEKHAKRLGHSVDRIAEDLITALSHYRWPGNVRELEALIQRAIILCDGTTLELEHVPNLNLTRQKPVPNSNMTLQAVERDHVTHVLQQTNWVVSGSQGAAQILGIPPGTLRSRIEKLDIKRSSSPS